MGKKCDFDSRNFSYTVLVSSHCCKRVIPLVGKYALCIVIISKTRHGTSSFKKDTGINIGLTIEFSLEQKEIPHMLVTISSTKFIVASSSVLMPVCIVSIMDSQIFF
jgi:hypothetical protein